jgi:hypothetical protein
MNKITFCSIFLLFALAGCREHTPMRAIPIHIVDISSECQTSFYENISEYGILPLEMTERSMLSDILKIKVYKEMICLLSGRMNSKLLVFTIDGKFIAEIGRRGRGPQEHIELNNFEIDPTRDELLLLDREGRKILIYDFNGNFKQEVKIPSPPECVGRLPNGNFVLSHAGYQLKFNNYHVLAICDENGEVLEQLIENKINTSIQISAREMMVAREDGSLSLMPQYHNMIYHITDNGIVPDIGFEIPGETLTVDNFNQDFTDPRDFFKVLEGKNCIPGNHAESERYISFYNNKGLGELEHVFYNKTSGESLRVKHPLFGTSVFIDAEGRCWSGINEASLTFSGIEDDELVNLFKEAFSTYENVPLLYYKLKI